MNKEYNKQLIGILKNIINQLSGFNTDHEKQELIKKVNRLTTAMESAPSPSIEAGSREALKRIEKICLKESISVEQMQKDFKSIYEIIGESLSNNKAHENSSYWQKRCEAAESYIVLSPCSPDIYPDQLAAYTEWLKFYPLSKSPTPEVSKHEQEAGLRSKEEILKQNIGNVFGLKDLTQWHTEFIYKAMEEYKNQPTIKEESPKCTGDPNTCQVAFCNWNKCLSKEEDKK